MKQILVSWSSAYDNILHFDESFSGMEKSDILNMSVVSSKFDKNHWWTWANIAYNLALLWENAVLLSSIWDDYDFSPVIQEKINLSYVHRQDMCHSANSVIISDSDNNKMTVFHPWAMQFASKSKLDYVQEKCSAAIVSANNIQTMIEHAKWLHGMSIPFFVDPAQQISQMNPDELEELLSYGTYLIANEHEFLEILQKTWKTNSELLEMYEIVVISMWEEWLELYINGRQSNIPAIKIDDYDDTTWAWDALRAGILYGITEWWDINTSCQLGTILASYCILAPGSQQHHFSLWGVMEDMKTHFWVEIDLFSKRKY